MYYAEGFGEIKLDSIHSKPTILTKSQYKKIKDLLHPYIVDFIEMAFKERRL